MHVHTIHSGMCTVPVFRRFCRESYNDPLELYQRLKARGMGFVTVTDHDSIDSVASLGQFPDFFLSEEVTCRTPDGTEFHMGVYDIDELQHVKLQEYRDDFPRLMAYLREQRLLFSINHVFSSLTGKRSARDFDSFRMFFPAVETRNGAMRRTANRRAAVFAGRNRKLRIGGSDSHTLLGAGRTFTEVRGARNKREFFDGLRQGVARVQGENGSYGKLTQDVLSIGWSMMKERPWTLALAPLVLAVPLFTLGHCLCEDAFSRRWARETAESIPAAMEALL
jgi:predicted metal-dependent phosphoesterase TrpH